MANFLRKPWIRSLVLDNIAPSKPYRAQIITIHPQSNSSSSVGAAFNVSDKQHVIRAHCSLSCMEKFSKAHPEMTMPRLKGSAIQILGCAVHPSLDFSEFILLVDDFCYVGNEGCLPFGNPVNVNEDAGVKSALERFKGAGESEFPLESDVMIPKNDAAALARMYPGDTMATLATAHIDDYSEDESPLDPVLDTGEGDEEVGETMWGDQPSLEVASQPPPPLSPFSHSPSALAMDTNTLLMTQQFGEVGLDFLPSAPLTAEEERGERRGEVDDYVDIMVTSSGDITTPQPNTPVKAASISTLRREEEKREEETERKRRKEEMERKKREKKIEERKEERREEKREEEMEKKRREEWREDTKVDRKRRGEKREERKKEMERKRREEEKRGETEKKRGEDEEPPISAPIFTPKRALRQTTLTQTLHAPITAPITAPKSAPITAPKSATAPPVATPISTLVSAPKHATPISTPIKRPRTSMSAADLSAVTFLVGVDAPRVCSGERPRIRKRVRRE